ncbi:MAG: hypothetical protein DWQ31_00320 [Planctomycetota bacterium]|nr:MAG: hypothetical protein DWQ31_00320 [Planctomycetota bacterium]REJ93224.1 MAG: hypothetical protein DWQ35_10735 [Planctomycetota bacterium]REK26039.1 MAG: hypothetical protein DWQ42_09900 [Planctomycetota bacterium]REK49434.1 MAG: hypothetical protein DWQ46_00370 [Planctomycetota bacterium]
MDRVVDITFDCLPLRSVGRLEIPLDASPRYRQRCERVKAAIAKHGSHNSYFLYNARCVFQLTNSAEVGRVEFRFEGCVLTDEADAKTTAAELDVELAGETCDWLSEPVVAWFGETVRRAVLVEFDRYMAAGDLERARQQVEKVQAECDDAGGYVGMYL